MIACRLKRIFFITGKSTCKMHGAKTMFNIKKFKLPARKICSIVKPNRSLNFTFTFVIHGAFSEKKKRPDHHSWLI